MKTLVWIVALVLAPVIASAAPPAVDLPVLRAVQCARAVRRAALAEAKQLKAERLHAIALRAVGRTTQPNGASAAAPAVKPKRVEPASRACWPAHGSARACTCQCP